MIYKEWVGGEVGVLISLPDIQLVLLTIVYIIEFTRITLLQIRHANIVIYSYHYILDPKISEIVSKGFPKESVIVFDEAHNIGQLTQKQISTTIIVTCSYSIIRVTDNVCIESMSIKISRKTLEQCTVGINNLQGKLRE